MTGVVVDEGQFVADLIYGRGQRPRSSAPEPALLPHLAAHLCHDFSIEEVLNAAWEFGHVGGGSPPWLPLWEATLWGVAGREDLVSFLDNLSDLSADHLRIVRALIDHDVDEANTLVSQGVTLGSQFPPVAGAARLAPLLPHDQVHALLTDPVFDPAALDAESVRSLLAAAGTHNIELSDDWIEAALNGEWFGIFQESRHAHLLPFLPLSHRTALADKLASRLTEMRLPPDMCAMWVSRIAAFVSSPDVWNRDVLFGEFEPVWQEHVDLLRVVSWPEQPWEDVFRAHPESQSFEAVARPHETTVDAPRDIVNRWQAHMAMAGSSGDDSEMEASPAPAPPTRGVVEEDAGDGTRSIGDLDEDEPPPEASAPPTEPRRLQADVLVGDTMDEVTAFVANQDHVIDVSIGRGARVRADVDFVESVFDDTDSDWLVLPIWFHASGQNQSGTLRVPRDQARNSTTASFSYVAPADGRVLIRIHVMRPGGGMLLQSAILAGDVVATAAEAAAHLPDIELSVDVMAGDLQDPPAAGNGRALIADQETALTESDGVPVEIDVSQMQDDLVQLVDGIVRAADRDDVDENAVAKKLVELAFAGQRLRGQFEPQLGDLLDASPLQIISLRSGDVLPLELIYDGPGLSSTSKICPTWKQALQEGSCANCAGGGPDNDPAPRRVCPMRFWSMHKIIERRTADAKEGPFRVSAERSAGRPNLRSIDAVVFAASGRVKGPAVTTLRDFSVTTLNVPAQVAENWTEWRDAIRSDHPELLIAMPHNQTIAGGDSSALMIGESTDPEAPVLPEFELLAGGVTEEHVQLVNDKPGPIVLLLGCNTQFEEGRLSGFAGEFREKGAALTVGTMGELRADHAPRAAHVLLEQIVQPTGGARSVGEVLLKSRRQLLGEGMIMALLLVGNGDAEWLLP